MAGATTKIFLAHGDFKRLRTAELSNWNGKAIAAPRSELKSVLTRDESTSSGVYFLTGIDPDSGQPAVYIGEAESIKERLKIHLGADFWNQVVFFVSKDENLTKAHIRYCEGQLIQMAKAAGRAKLMNSQSSGAKLPESDREDMEVFLEKMQQLLPALGVEVLVPLYSASKSESEEQVLTCKIKNLEAKGYLTPNGIVVLNGSKAVLEDRPSTKKYPHPSQVRQKLKNEGKLSVNGDHLVFTQNVEFSSPSAAASVIHGGHANGRTAWRNKAGKSLKDLESIEA